MTDWQRGTQGGHRARSGRQAPLSGRQGAIPDEVTCPAEERPVDTIADARGVAS